MNEYLSDTEKSKIETFIADTVMVEAVRKVLLAAIYENGTLRANVPADPTRNAALGLAALSNKGVVSNQELGEDIRGLWQGINLLENGFNKLTKITTKVESAPENKENPAV